MMDASPFADVVRQVPHRFGRMREGRLALLGLSMPAVGAAVVRAADGPDGDDAFRRPLNGVNRPLRANRPPAP
jgi:hypothetical protein